MSTIPGSTIWKGMAVRALVCLALAGGMVAAVGCTSKTAPSFKRGQQIYKTDCTACHGPNGEGVLYSQTVLDGSKFVTGNPEEVVAVILHGREGASSMPGWQKKFNDQQVAAVTTYIRQAWSNRADPVTGQMVSKVRSQKK